MSKKKYKSDLPWSIRTWQDDFNAMALKNDGLFGSNVEWSAEEARKYIAKLGDLGAWSIDIPDDSTIQFKLPVGEVKAELLLFILTGGGPNGRQPLSASFNKRRQILTLDFDY